MPDPKTHGFLSMLAESWQVSPDGKEFIANLRTGVQFHKGWGEMTAEDVAFAYNNASGRLNPESTHDNAPEIGQTWDPWYAKDKYTAVGPFYKPFKAMRLWDVSIGSGSAPNIFSKKVYDQLGPEKALVTLVATGPYEAMEWTPGDRVVAEAVVNHWRIVPGFKTVIIREVPEESSRVAMMKTGEVDIAEISMKNVEELMDLGMKANDSMDYYTTQSIYFAGNFWQEKDINGDVVFPRPGFKPDAAHPWIGDPRDSTSMEKARKVRLALNMALDRETLHETILAGVGRVSYQPGGVYPGHPWWQDKWFIPYDLAKAKALLKEAGYEEGFDLPFQYPPDFALVEPELAEAVAAQLGDLGVSVKLQRTAYAAIRPSLMSREIDIPWFWFVDTDPLTYDSTNIRILSAQPGWNGGFEIEELWDFAMRIWDAGDDQEQLRQVITDRMDFLSKWVPYGAVADVPKIYMENPKRLQDWEMYWEQAGSANSFEVIKPVR